MIRNADDADVGRSVRAYRHHAEVARRELAKARSRIAAIEPLLAGGKHTRALALAMHARASRRADECRRELRYWLGAVDGILTVHLEHEARRVGWRAPVAHDPANDNKQGIPA